MLALLSPTFRIAGLTTPVKRLCICICKFIHTGLRNFPQTCKYLHLIAIFLPTAQFLLVQVLLASLCQFCCLQRDHLGWRGPVFCCQSHNTLSSCPGEALSGMFLALKKLGLFIGDGTTHSRYFSGVLPSLL